MKMRAQYAPKGVTIAVAAVLVIVGVLGTFLGLIPDVGSVTGETIGVLAYVAATIVMLIGIFTKGL
jgi:hypothetical protein